MSDLNPQVSDEHDEPPPVLGSWRALYLVLVVELVLLTLAGYLLGRWAA